MISFVLPIYNCYPEFLQSVPAFRQWISDRQIPCEIIVVDDHSDPKKDVCELINWPQMSCLYNEKNYGKGYSVKKGFMAAKGEWLIFMDGDFPFDFSVFDTIVRETAFNDADILAGDRTLAESSYPANLSFLRKLGSKVLSAFASRFITDDIYDTQCGIKAFRKDVATDLFSQLTQNGFSFDLELLFLARKKKYRLKKIPVIVRQQNGSSVRVFRDGMTTIISLIKIYFNKISRHYKI